MNSNQFKFPELIFEEFFSGKVQAKGHLIQYFPRIKKKNLIVDFEGKYKNEELGIKESYYEENVSLIRHWKFKKILPKSFIGQEKNVSGEIKVNINNNSLRMDYLFKILFKKIPINVKVKDHMFLISNDSLINTSIVSKYGIRLAETLLLYKKLS